MRARAHRLVVLSVSIEIPFLKSVKRWNDGRTPVFRHGEYQLYLLIFYSVIRQDAAPSYDQLQTTSLRHLKVLLTSLPVLKENFYVIK